MEYANQIQKLTERSVSGCASGCTQCLHSADKVFLLVAQYKCHSILLGIQWSNKNRMINYVYTAPLGPLLPSSG